MARRLCAYIYVCKTGGKLLIASPQMMNEKNSRERKNSKKLLKMNGRKKREREEIICYSPCCYSEKNIIA